MLQTHEIELYYLDNKQLIYIVMAINVKFIMQHVMIEYFTWHKKIMHSFSFSLYIVFLMVQMCILRWCKRANLNAFFSIFISSLWHLIYDVRCDWITYCYSFKSNFVTKQNLFIEFLKQDTCFLSSHYLTNYFW